jgi:hypothetical protein|uniref:Uncharacterized protein n=1 Tax=Leviviridae sp. TaxID=2027243 RepID=A0A514D9L6_9VIRU|nr:MAG: hypothetical protein H1Bulk29715_000002 [Leviviridae sp.]
MAFADPQSVTVNSVAQSMPRTGSGIDSGAFSTADGSYKLTVRHSNGRRNRHEIRLTQTKTSADPLLPSQNQVFSMSAYAVVDTPLNGFSVTEAKYVCDALFAYLTASSGAKVTQLLGGES